MDRTSNDNNSYSDDVISTFSFHDNHNASINCSTEDFILEMTALSKSAGEALSIYAEESGDDYLQISLPSLIARNQDDASVSSGLISTAHEFAKNIDDTSVRFGYILIAQNEDEHYLTDDELLNDDYDLLEGLSVL